MHRAGRKRQVYVQHGSCLHHSGRHVRERLDACLLLSRRTSLLLPIHGNDLCQRAVRWPGRFSGLLLDPGMCCWGDMLVAHDLADVHRGAQRLHHLHNHKLLRHAGLRTPRDFLSRSQLGRMAHAQ